MRTLITKLIICTQVMLCSMALMNQASAMEDTGSSLSTGSHIGNNIENLVFDQTISPEGREFYRAFVKAWRKQNDSERYHVLVYERRTDLGANKLWVEYRLRKLFSGIALIGKQNVLEKMGAYAAQAVLQGINAINADEMLDGQEIARNDL